MLHADFKRHHPKGQNLEWAGLMIVNRLATRVIHPVRLSNETRTTSWDKIGQIGRENARLFPRVSNQNPRTFGSGPHSLIPVVGGLFQRTD